MAGSDKTTDHDHNRTTSLDEVLAAYAELEANRGAVDCEAFIAKYPALEAELREFFADKEMLDEFVPPDGGSSNGSNQLTEMFMGSVLGRFELRREHARGGLGKVWKAHDPILRRDVALKEIREEQAQNPIARHRFLREAQVTGQLEHPNIVPVHELGRDSKDDRLFYTMRFVSGETLREVIQEHHRKFGRRAPEASRRLLNKFVNICEAMAYAHARGVVHRDLKPHNIAIGEFGEVVVMDWGLAKIGEKDDESAQSVGISSEADGQATVVGHALGTPAYMAPEQASGRTKEINSRTDVYGLGAILFEILAGSAPHRGPTTDAILQAIQHRETPTTRDRLPTVPKPLDAICAKAMAKKGCDRYGNALELARDIQHWLDDEPISVCPETLLRRASRWQRRHRSVVALVLMFAMLVGSCIGWLTVASRQRLRAQLEAWQVEVVTNRDQARVDLLEQNFDQGLTKCDDTLLNLKFQPEYLQRVAARSNETEGVLSRQLLDALSELVFLKGRAELMLASTPSEEDERRAAAKQAFEVADAWSSAPAASRLFRNAFLDRKLSAHQILSRDDTDVPATALDHLLVGEVAQFAGDRERAIRHYEDALESEPTHFWAHLLIGIARFEQGESITALESFNQAARLKPEVAWIYAGRALILADLARWDAAHADLDLAESLLAQTESPDPSHYVVPNNRSVVLYTQARTDGSASMEDRKRWLTSAIAQSERASELNDAFENAYNNSGMAAVEMARLLRSENPEDAEIELYLNRASDAFGVARTRGSNKVRPSVNRALMSIEFSDGQESELQRARRDLEDARLYAESLDGVELRSATRLIVYGHAFADGIVAEQRIKAAADGEEIVDATVAVEKALQHFSEVVPDTPQNELQDGPSVINDHLAREARLARAKLRYQLFELYANFNEHLVTDELIGPMSYDFDALTTLEDSRHPPKARAELFEMRAKVEDWLKMKGDALLDYTRAIEVDPSNASRYLHRGKLLLNARDQALRDFEQAITVEPPSSDNALTRAMAYGNRACLLALDSQSSEAIKAAESASHLAPTSWEVLFQAALAYALCVNQAESPDAQLLGKDELADKAIEYLKKTLELFQDGNSQWKQKWPPLLKDSGFDAIRDREGFQALLR